MMEQLILSKKARFGRSSEKMPDPEQIRFMEALFPRLLRLPLSMFIKHLK